MNQFDFFGFWVPSVLMGLGIAIDVSIATVSKFRDRSMRMTNWTLPIMSTHIVFPAVGYYMFWGLGKQFAFLSPVLGIVGFAFVFAFVYEVVCEAAGKEAVFGISAWLSRVMGLREDDSRRFIAILAVSWDALWSGPAKAAQAIAGRWTTLEVVLSFAIAGLTVAVVAQAALVIARLLRRKKFQSVEQMATWFFWGKHVELSVIGGFGVLSLSEAVLGFGNLYTSVGVAGLSLLLVWRIFRKEIAASSFEEALEAIGEEECDCDDAVVLHKEAPCLKCGRPIAL
ncbi:MAG: hypothetical protein WAV15_00340 [Minisyncoccia bacterium]